MASIRVADNQAEQRYDVFVDDQPRNILGAQRAGLDAVAFDVTAPARSFAEAARRLGLPANAAEASN